MKRRNRCTRSFDGHAERDRLGQRVAEDEHAVDQEAELVEDPDQRQHLARVDRLVHGLELFVDRRLEADGDVLDPRLAHRRPAVRGPWPCPAGSGRSFPVFLPMRFWYSANMRQNRTVSSRCWPNRSSTMKNCRASCVSTRQLMLPSSRSARGAPRLAFDRAELAVHAAAADSLDREDHDSGVAHEREIRDREAHRNPSAARGPACGPRWPSSR